MSPQVPQRGCLSVLWKVLSITAKSRNQKAYAILEFHERIDYAQNEDEFLQLLAECVTFLSDEDLEVYELIRLVFNTSPLLFFRRLINLYDMGNPNFTQLEYGKLMEKVEAALIDFDSLLKDLALLIEREGFIKRLALEVQKLINQRRYGQIDATIFDIFLNSYSSDRSGSMDIKNLLISIVHNAYRLKLSALPSLTPISQFFLES